MAGPHEAKTAVLAVQTPDPGKSLLAKASSCGAYFCNDASWTNNCAHWAPLTDYACYTLDAAHQNSISS
ncbi:hypothetical protein C8R45DRAFT_1103412 [Mycena sanguinolenta]|nr:hypothetical protein C8R45DRAFT_1103412 [Mycena sanguinolenta]